MLTRETYHDYEIEYSADLGNPCCPRPSDALTGAGDLPGIWPQTPRDISSKAGLNDRIFSLAPPASKLNLCNFHTHTNAEHKGPGFSVFAGDSDHGGYKCNESDTLTAAELEDPTGGHGAFHGIVPGDTI